MKMARPFSDLVFVLQFKPSSIFFLSPFEIRISVYLLDFVNFYLHCRLFQFIYLSILPKGNLQG